jgi:carbonic anhydrase
METLLKGVQAFNENYYRPRRALFEALASGQRPGTLFITCSDSRIDPNLLTQTEPGELFVLRNAGNIIPPYGVGGGESATVEYAVSVLQVADIVVCGHSNCGAMKALLRREQAQELPAVAAWLAHAEPVLDGFGAAHTAADEAAMLDALTERNVLAQLDNLRAHPAVAARLATGTLRLHGWVYQIKHGTVTVHDPLQSRFVPVGAHREAGAGARL